MSSQLTDLSDEEVHRPGKANGHVADPNGKNGAAHFDEDSPMSEDDMPLVSVIHISIILVIKHVLVPSNICQGSTRNT